MVGITHRSRDRALAIFLLGGLTVGGCTQIDNALAKVPVFAFMRRSPFFDPYEHPLPPPPGSVPFESPNGPVLPPLQATEQALNEFAAGPYGRNPFPADDATALTRGQTMFERHCAVCHGTQGGGDGPLRGPGKFPIIPSLIAGPATSRPDGYLYGIIRAGRGLMPAYGARMTHTERWSIVVYVNHLQSRAGAPAAPAAAPAPVPGGAAPADTAAAARDTLQTRR